VRGRRLCVGKIVISERFNVSKLYFVKNCFFPCKQALGFFQRQGVFSIVKFILYLESNLDKCMNYERNLSYCTVCTLCWQTKWKWGYNSVDQIRQTSFHSINYSRKTNTFNIPVTTIIFLKNWAYQTVKTAYFKN
jgi:hypothetical protein